MNTPGEETCTSHSPPQLVREMHTHTSAHLSERTNLLTDVCLWIFPQAQIQCCLLREKGTRHLMALETGTLCLSIHGEKIQPARGH